MTDPKRPLFHWFVDCSTGKELVLALYTLPCRYARCVFCSLPSLAEGGDRVRPQDIDAQVDWILSHYDKTQLDQVTKVSVYTAASTLDQKCLPTRSLMYLLLKVCDLPALKLLSLETRPEYVEDWELRMLSEVLGEGIQVEAAIGYETHDPHLRNTVLKKGLTEKSLRMLMERLSSHQGALKAYVMLKPHHSLTEQGGVDEAIHGLDHLHGLGQEFGVPVSIHLNPTYIAEGCALTDELVAAGYEPPELTSVIRVAEESIQRGMPLYAGLDDEGLALKGGTFQSTGLDAERAVAAILSFNRHQDVARMKREAGA
ncbi:MAG: hypothetical protein GY913_04450 [Proteobacteria bacterium]|nr:hypothetical protein [Pseudomonadota bacterium]MCP4916152.1 hypothetical protein [Pseudomonadota bacterium]